MSDKGLSISWVDFTQRVPNGAWVRQLSGSTLARLDLPIEGVVFFGDVDEINSTKVQAHTLLKVTPTTQLDPIVLYAGDVEYKLDGDWIDFRTLCHQATTRRLEEARGPVEAAVDAHPLQWMTHAQELNMSVAQIGTQLYTVARWIEANGNKGYSDDDLMKALPPLRIRVLGNAYKLAWENILFYGEGSRKRDFAGWGVHKYKPQHWTRTWLERFGLDHPLAEGLMDAAWDEAHADHARRAVKRPHDTYLGVDLEQAPTREIAHKAAAMSLLSRWARQRVWQHGDTRELWGLQVRLYDTAYDVFRDELVYRIDQPPQPRRSKKKTQAARDDWATAADYFEAPAHHRLGFGFEAPRPAFNIHRFYSAVYIEACCESDTVPDLGVDFDTLPRGLSEAVDVRAVRDETVSDEAEV